MTTQLYSIWAIHPYSPQSNDTLRDVSLTGTDLQDRVKLGAALRSQKILDKGEGVQSFSKKQSGHIVVFPRVPGSTTHPNLLLTPLDRPLAQADTLLQRAMYAGTRGDRPSQAWTTALDEARKKLSKHGSLRDIVADLEGAARTIRGMEGAKAVQGSADLLRDLKHLL